ncbi:COMM domain-containing protein 10 isoform 8 [Mus musculus]|uniref:COMM domain-containing protein 10 isoform 8 n=1 Tax=Mus musculus TaxID=10090 RepID=UPI0003D715A5|nr:COMM domain-containing protein 10 isoform 8 [Mus musculus]|eukprot:XP_006526290.1 PREDICTED: COMM domain-containing protein 10 isoform X4 [Mus musculus]
MAASAALILPESPSMKKAVPLINAIDTGRFPRLLSRILQKLHLKLETVGWQLNLQMAHSAQAKLQSPQAVLQLGVSKEDAKFQTVSSDHIHPTSPTPRSTSPHPNYASSFICPTWRKFSWNSITRSCSISTTSWRPYKRSWTPSHDVLEDWLPSPSHSGHLTLSH